MENNSRVIVLRQRSQFLKVKTHGKATKPAHWLLVGYMPNDCGHLRCGWTLPKRVGIAVVRNRLKRWCRVYFQSKTKTGQNPSIDVSLVFRQAEEGFYRTLKYQDFTKVMDRAWKTFSHVR